MPDTSRDNADQIVDETIDVALRFAEQASAPGTPGTGWLTLYAKSDGRLYLKDDTGAEVGLDAVSGGAAVLKTLYDAYTALVANSDNTPAALTIGTNTFLGRAAGNIEALAVATSTLVGRTASGNLDDLTPSQATNELAAAWFYHTISSAWYDGTPSAGNTDMSGTYTLTVDRIYAVPFWCPKTINWSTIGVRCIGADAGKKIKIGVYACTTTTMQPGARLYGSAEMTLDATGDKSEATGGLSLAAGLYFLALRSDSGAATLRSMQRVYVGGLLGVADLNSDPGQFWYSGVGTYAINGLPDPFPAPTVDVATGVPRVMLQAP